VTVSTQSILVAWMVLEDRKLLSARARDPDVTLTMAERHLLADINDGTFRWPKGRPSVHAILRRSKSLAVASTFIWEIRGDETENRKRPFHKTREEHGDCTDRVIEKHLAFARAFCGGQWWATACKLARKGKKKELQELGVRWGPARKS